MTETFDARGMLIVAMLNAPLIGIGPNRKVLHAVPMEHVHDAYETGSAVAACGSRGLKFMRLEDSEMAAPWPPASASLIGRFVRCEDCLALVRPKRPRVRFAERTREEPS